MASPKSKKKFNLICVAHPDDETIFFGGLIQRRRQGRPWTVVCATSDGDLERKKQFESACKLLGIKEFHWWAFPDRYEQRLPIEQLSERLRSLGSPDEIFTHGIVGEYGHPHHQDVSYAVHTAFPKHPKLYSVAYNTFPDLEIKLTKKEFETKARILTKVYGSETSRFLNVLPSTYVEGFQKLKIAEVSAVYGYLAQDKPLSPKTLKAHKWLEDYLPKIKNLPRPF